MDIFVNMVNDDIGFCKKGRSKNAALLVCIVALLIIPNSNCASKERDNRLNTMTLEEKVARLFFITPEALTGVDCATTAAEITKKQYSQYPVGGIIYFEQNICSREQISKMLSDMQSIAKEVTGIPVFLAVDEEGGTVTRVAKRIDGIPVIDDMYSVGQAGNAYATGEKIGFYLSELGFNVDFAPVADIFTDPNNPVIGRRAFGNSAEVVSACVRDYVAGIEGTGIRSTLKHFPGHGNTSGDSHNGTACNFKSIESLYDEELVPFMEGISQGVSFVMVGHISLPNILGNELPASLSYEVMTELLREGLDFDGIIITDAMNMGAITGTYTSGQAAIMSILGGADMILMPLDFVSAYEEVLSAVNNGIIAESRIDESVERIINTVSME